MNTITFPGVVGSIEVYMDVMRAICGETWDHSMADLCCCTAPNTPNLGFRRRQYFDIVHRDLDHRDEQEFFSQKDVLTLSLDVEGRFDVAICSDGIEHLSYEDGVKLIKVMQSISYRQVIFTPLDDLFGMAKEGNADPEAHRSLWKPEMLADDWCCIIFPDYHKEWNGGAWFGFCVDNWRDQEFDIVKKKLKTKHWYNGIHE